MSEPLYVRQCGDPLTEDQEADWLTGAIAEARAEGMTHFRACKHPTNPNLRLLEGWPERPLDEGEPRWAVTA